MNRMRTYSVINLLGLTLSMIVITIIMHYTHQELTVDDYIPEIDRSYLMCNYAQDQGYYSTTDAYNMNHDPDFDDAPHDKAVECFTRFIPLSDPQLSVDVDNASYLATVFAIDSMFLEMLPCDVIQGTSRLNKPTDAIITSDFASKAFKGKNPIGQQIVLNDFTLNVTGVVDRPHTKSLFNYDVLVCDTLTRWMYIGDMVCRLKKGEDYHKFNERHVAFKDYVGNNFHFQLMPLKDAYFSSKFSIAPTQTFISHGNKQSIIIMLSGAALLFLIVLFNYTHMFNIMMRRRQGNFGIRKIFGAGNKDVFAQIFTENFMITAIAVCAAWIVVGLATPILQRYYNITLLPSPLFDVCMTICIALVFPTIVSVVMMLKYHSVRTVKSMQLNYEDNFHRTTHYIPLCVQYLATFILLTASLYAISQLHYLLTADMGYQTHDIISANITPHIATWHREYRSEDDFDKAQKQEEAMEGQAENILQRMRQSPLFIKSCFFESNGKASLTEGKKETEYGDLGIKVEGSKGDYVNAEWLDIPVEFFDIYGLKVVEGRMLDVENGETMDSYKMMITENTKRTLGIKDIHSVRIMPKEALWFRSGMSTNQSYEIVGVVKDFETHHLASAETPKIITVDKSQWSPSSTLIARVQKGKHKEAVDFLKKTQREVYGTAETDYRWIEDEFAEIYEDDSRTTLIFNTLAIVAIAVSILGLFGVCMYDIQHRRKEIAIRKVNGAKFKDIFRLMSRQYALTLLIAIIIATPITMYVLNLYIADYAHHTALTPWYFICSALIMTALTFVTIFWQIKKASSGNPAEVIKSE